MINDLGELTLGQVVPGAEAAINVAVGVSLPTVQAQLAGALAAQAKLTISPPTLAGQLNALAAMTAAVQAAIMLGLPTVNLQLTGLATLIADLQVKLAALQINISFGQAGIYAYLYQGRADGLGEFSSRIPGGNPNNQVSGILVAASSPAAIGAMAQVFVHG